MKLSLLLFFMLFNSLIANALEGIESLEIKLFELNQEIASHKKIVESQEALHRSSNSGFYPTLNAVGGWEQNKTDEISETQKGYVGYIEGKFNLFRGFKDHSAMGLREIALQIAKLDLEEKRREIRLRLTELSSDMIGLHKLQALLDEEFRVTQTQKQMAAKKVSAGLTGSVDNLEFELRENEIQIEQRQISQLHQETHQKFIALLGQDVPDVDLEKMDFSSADSLLKGITQVKIENTIAYQKSVLSKARSELEKKEVRSDFLPSLDFSYSAGRLTPMDSGSMKFNESKYTVLLTIPLFSGFDTYYKNRAANLNIESAEKMKSQKLRDTESEFNITKMRLSELGALFLINEKKLVNSQKYFDLTLAEYRRGVKNSPDLVNATERWFSSKKKRIELLKELEILKVQLESYN